MSAPSSPAREGTLVSFPYLGRTSVALAVGTSGLAIDAVYLGSSVWVALRNHWPWLIGLAGLVAIVVAVLVVAIVRAMRACRLVLDSDGLRFFGVGYRSEARWRDVRLGRRATGEPAFELDQPAIAFDGWLGSLARILSAAGLVPSGVSIALREVSPLWFSRDWPQGRLADTVRSLAPGLLPAAAS